MKSGKGLLLIALSAVLVIYSCKKGDTGATGATGPTGSTGATGAQGPAGAANVIASKWIRLDSSLWTYAVADSIQFMGSFYNNITGQFVDYLDTEIDYHAVMPTPLITKAIKDSGLVLFYYKDSTGNGDPASIGKVAIYHPGLMHVYTTTANHLNENNMFEIYNESDSLGSSITFKTRWDGSKACTVPGLYHYYHPYPIYFEQLPCKTNLYFRYIMIPAAKTLKTTATIDYTDYNAVLQYYHLADK